MFIERFDPRRGGREQSTGEIARGLVRHGCEVDVVCLSGVLAGGGVNVVRLGGSLWGRTASLRRFVSLAPKQTRAGRYDVTHAMLPLPGADVYQLRGGTAPGLREGHMRMLGPAGRIVRRVTWPCNRMRALLARLERRVVRQRATLCLPVSNMVAEEIRRFYGPDQNVRVVYNGVAVPAVPDAERQARRLEARTGWGASEEDFVLVCPAMNFRLKGVDRTIEAFSRFRRAAPNCSAKLVVLGQAGTGAGRGVGGPAGDVLFCGYTPEIWSAYAGADAVVLLSWYDPCSRVVLEATGFGVPCVTTRFNGAAETLSDGAGVLVDTPADTDAVAEAFGELADPVTRAGYADACRRIAPRLDVAGHVEKLLTIYREIAHHDR